MKSQSRRLKVRMAALLLILCFLLAGCGFGGFRSCSKTRIVFTMGFEPGELFRVGSLGGKKSEFYIYLLDSMNQYEAVYGESIFDVEAGGVTLRDQLKENALARLSRVKTLNLLAADAGITLDETETENAEAAAESYWNSLSSEAIETLGLHETLVYGMFYEYALADKTHRVIVDEATPEISDDEARVVTLRQILIKKYYRDLEGVRQEYGTEIKIDLYKKILEAQTRLNDGEDFVSVAADFDESETDLISVAKGERDENFEKAAFNLGTGEISEIFDCEEGYCILLCVDAFNRNETDARKKILIEEAREQTFLTRYDEFATGLNMAFNDELWKNITIPEKGGYLTESFFTKYEEWCGQK